MHTDVSEKGLENIIENWLINENRFEQGTNTEFNRDYALDEGRLFRFLSETQPLAMKELRILDSSAERTKFLDRLNKKLSDSGVI